MSTETDFKILGGILLHCNPELNVPEIVVPEGVKVIGYRAFASLRFHVHKIVLPEGVLSIGNEAFSWNIFLEEVVLPKSLVSIGSGVFTNCHSLRSLHLPQNLRYLAVDALGYGCTLEEIWLPASLEYFNNSFFETIPYIERINIAPGFKEVQEIGPLILSKDGKELLFCQRDVNEELDIPEGVEVIRNNALFHCKRLQTVFFPASVRIIGNRTLEDCDRLKAVHMASIQTFEKLPFIIKREILRNLVNSLRQGKPVTVEVCDAVVSWVRKEPHTFLKNSEVWRFFLRYELIPADMVDDLIDGSIRDQNPSLTAEILEYAGKHLTQEDRDRIAEKRFSLE